MLAKLYGYAMHRFKVTGGLSVAADVGGDVQNPVVVLLHGGGQTRHSWRKGFDALVEAGYHVVSLDARGHGDSDWAPDGDYRLDALVSDLRSVLAQIPEMPIVIGASLGGMTGLAAVGEAQAPIARALVLVDITPGYDTRGTDHIAAFMNANLDGFGSIDEAADAVARYNPNRPRPKNPEGLRRNLRERDGRLYWHWDPRFLSHGELHPDFVQGRLEAAAQRVRVATLLIRGGFSDVIGDEQVDAFRKLMPAAECVTVAGAGHMVAGDRNDAFNRGILEFIARQDNRSESAYSR
ncbi:alpha/beta fold hydrolase [Cupriavidus necator]|uniref:alpha/beta fold hydrolase n=1 Tax=Cupriavidus necator TaxID=106590 RepID=UPI0002E7EF5E|nr:alpha/beta hydrolase [Cupriavidus necator]MDX6008152.1 alpha/beta hydrolase [Cupriavidus necator]